MTLIREMGYQRGGGLVVLLILLLGVVAAMVGIYSYAAVQARHFQEYRNLADTLRASVQQIGKYAELAAAGEVPAFSTLQKYRDRGEEAVLQMHGGSVETGLPALSLAEPGVLEELAVQWRRYRNSADTILAYQEEIFRLQESLQALRQSLPELISVSEEVASALVQRRSNAAQVYIATRQLVLLQRIGRDLELVSAGGAEGVQAMERLEQNRALFTRVVTGMLERDAERGVAAVHNQAIRSRLKQLQALTEGLERRRQAVQEALPVVSRARAVADEISSSVEQMLGAVERLEGGYALFDEKLQRWTTLNYLLGAAALLLLVLIALQLRRQDRLRLAAIEEQRRQSEEQNQRNQQAILRLLDEMGNLADGDLTVQATVTEDITGAIADSINFAVDALRHLVRSINETTDQVSSAAQNVQVSTQQLAVDSGKQAERIHELARQITDMAGAIEKISADAAVLADEAKCSVESAAKGADAVRSNLLGMDAIREQIQETAKRMKRLGESSQEIGNIVELIKDIAEQTNILALNASLQAAMDGESGRAFAVVAEEVQRLAERSASATRDIEILVRTIQTDTSEAVHSMEQSTEGVVKGTQLAQGVGRNLEDIDRVAQHLAELIQNISNDARGYAESASSVSSAMSEIQSLSLLTSDGLNRATAAIGHLAESVNTLKRSVAGFKLPE